MQQIIIRVTACGLVMAWSWIGVLATEARNQQRKAKEGLVTCCHPSYAFLQLPRKACHSAGMLLLWPIPWVPSPWHSASLLESLRGRSYPSQWRSHDCCKIWETCPAKHLKKFSLPWHWTWWGFFIPGQMSVDFCYIFLPDIFSDKSSKHLMETEPCQVNAVWMKLACLETILNDKFCLRKFPFCHSVIRNVVSISIW